MGNSHFSQKERERERERKKKKKKKKVIHTLSSLSQLPVIQ